MKIFHKLFISLFFSIFIITTTSLYIFYLHREKGIISDYKNNYQSISNILSNTILLYEDLVEEHLQTAFFYFQKKFHENPDLSQDDLKIFLKELNTSNAYIIANNGDFLLATNEALKVKRDKKLNLFDFCIEYKQLLLGPKKQPRLTPIVIVKEGDTPSKFIMGPSIDGNFLLELGINIEKINNILSKPFSQYKNIQKISLETPTGDLIGNIQRADENTQNLSSYPKDEFADDYILIERKVPSKIKNCCECKIKHELNSPDEYYYHLKVYFSKSILDKSLNNIRKIIFIIYFIAIILSFIISYLIANLSVKRLKLLNHVIKKSIANGKLLKVKPFIYNDELTELTHSYNNLIEKINEITLELTKNTKNIAIGEIATQVFHDIRSPLTALEVATNDLSQIPEESRLLITEAVNRIQDIANNLLSKRRILSNQEKKKTLHLYMTIASIISEKRFSCKNKNISFIVKENFYDYSNFVNISEMDLKIILSNLLNNSIEAMNSSNGDITVETNNQDNKINIFISDKGKGIPKEIQNSLGKKEISYGKSHGNGIGFIKAKCMLEKYNGHLEIIKTNNEGTTIKITLKKSKDPSWYLPVLKVEKIVIVVDDDNSVFEIWKKRLNQLFTNNRIKLIHLKSPEETIKWADHYCQQKSYQDTSNILFLCDYEFLNSSINGIELIKKLNITKSSVLVTSHFSDETIIENCKKLSIKIIPKSLVAKIPIKPYFNS